MEQITLTLTLKYEDNMFLKHCNGYRLIIPATVTLALIFPNLKLPEDGITSELLIFEEPNINEDILSVPNFVIVFMHVSVFFFLGSFVHLLTR